MKKILSSIFILTVFLFGSINVQANDSHLHDAIISTEAVEQATDAKEIEQHLDKALGHARQAVKLHNPEEKYIQAGLECLEDAHKEAKANNTDAAKKSAADALNKFKKARETSGKE